VRACVGALCKRTILFTVSRDPKAPPQGQRPHSNGARGPGPGARGPGLGAHGPQSTVVRSPLRGHHVAESAHGGRVLGSSPGPSCNLHSSRNRRPDGRTNGRTDERNISGSGERERVRRYPQRRRTPEPCYFMATVGS